MWIVAIELLVFAFTWAFFAFERFVVLVFAGTDHPIVALGSPPRTAEAGGRLGSLSVLRQEVFDLVREDVTLGRLNHLRPRGFSCKIPGANEGMGPEGSVCQDCFRLAPDIS